MLGDFVKIRKDLVDRGPDSPGVVRLVRHLVQLGKAGHVPKLFWCWMSPTTYKPFSEAELCVVLTRHNAFLAIMSWIFFVESTSMETTGSLANLKSSARTELSALRILRWVRSVFYCFLTQSLDTPCRSDAVPRDRGRTRRQKVSKFLQTSSFARRRTKINKDGNGNSNSVWLEREKADCINYFYWSESNVLHHLLLWEMFLSNGKTELCLSQKSAFLRKRAVEVKDFFLSLPMALERDDVVVVHAAWDEESDAQRCRAVRFRWVHFRTAESKRMVHSMRSSEKLRQSEGNAIHSVYQALWRQNSMQTSDGRSIVVSTCFKLWRIASFLTQMAWLSRSIHLSC